MKNMSLNLKKLTTFLLVMTLELSDFMVSVSGRYFALNNIFYMLIILIIILLSPRRKIGLSSDESMYFLYWIYGFVMTIIGVMFMGLSIPFEYIYHIVYMLLVLLFLRRHLFSGDCFWKTLYVLSIIQCFILVYQEYSRLKVGDFIRFVFYAQEGRPAALFSEPAHFSMLICFVICCVLFRIDTLRIEDKKRIIIAAFLSVMAIISVSSSGLVYVVYIWGTWFLWEKKAFKKKFLVILVSIVILSIILTQTDWIARAFSHLTDTDFRRTTSGSFRMMRGFDLLSRMSIVSILFGFGVGNTAEVIRTTGFISIYDHMGNLHNVYVSVLSTIFLETGIVGFIIFSIYMYKVEKNGNYVMKVFGGLYFLYILVNEVIYTPQIFVILFVILIEKDNIKNSKGNVAFTIRYSKKGGVL